MDRRLKIIIMRTIKWNRLSGKVVQSPSLEVSRSDRIKPRATFSHLRDDSAVSRCLDWRPPLKFLNNSVNARKQKVQKFLLRTPGEAR